MNVRRRLVPAPLLGVGLLVGALTACGPTQDSSNGGGGDGGRSDGGSAWYLDGPRYSWDGPGGPDFVPDANDTCASSSTKAQLLPLDIYIMQDQSGSMDDPVSGGTKWTALGNALNAFLQQPLTDVSVGIQFFPVAGNNNCNVSSCSSDAQCGTACGSCVPDPFGGGNVCANYGSPDSCTVGDYATPAVAIAPLPGVYSSIRTAWLAHGPTNSTPTSAALQGAINYAKSWAGYHPGHVTIVILSTDGDPTECDTNLAHIDAIAAAGVSGTPKILTFVIGVGSSLSNLNGIAQSGGTSAPFLVDTGGNVTQQMLQALNAIRGAALACTYTLPTSDGGAVDPNKVNVQYTPGSGGGAETIPQASDQAHCPASGDAWYYDNPTAPTKIILCPATCQKVTPDSSGEVDIVLGCQTTTIS